MKKNKPYIQFRDSKGRFLSKKKVTPSRKVSIVNKYRDKKSGKFISFKEYTHRENIKKALKRYHKAKKTLKKPIKRVKEPVERYEKPKRKPIKPEKEPVFEYIDDIVEGYTDLYDIQDEDTGGSP